MESMMEEEEKAWQYFEKLKSILPIASPHLWRTDFESYIDKFINEKLREEEMVADDPEMDYTHLHGLWHLVAGAFQELELVQQSEHAATCAKIDGALVWQCRGYVN